MLNKAKNFSSPPVIILDNYEFRKPEVFQGIYKQLQNYDYRILDLAITRNLIPPDTDIAGVLTTRLAYDPLVKNLNTSGCKIIRLGSYPNPYDKIIPAVLPIGGQGTYDGYDIEVVAQGAPQTAPETTDTGTADTGDGSLVVSTTADSGVGSLRDAIAIAGYGETVIIDGSIGTITLLTEIIIEKSITIDGSGVAIVNGDNMTRIFKIQNDERDIDVTLKNIGIADAKNSNDEFGGAIYNKGQALTLDTVLFDGNENDTPEGKGGAVYSSGTLETNNCAFRNNKASEEDDLYQE